VNEGRFKVDSHAIGLVVQVGVSGKVDASNLLRPTPSGKGDSSSAGLDVLTRLKKKKEG